MPYFYIESSLWLNGMGYLYGGGSWYFGDLYRDCFYIVFYWRVVLSITSKIILQYLGFETCKFLNKEKKINCPFFFMTFIFFLLIKLGKFLIKKYELIGYHLLVYTPPHWSLLTNILTPFRKGKNEYSHMLLYEPS